MIIICSSKVSAAHRVGVFHSNQGSGFFNPLLIAIFFKKSLNLSKNVLFLCLIPIIFEIFTDFTLKMGQIVSKSICF